MLTIFIAKHIPLYLGTDAWKEYARKMTPGDVGDYLKSIKLDRYVEAFADEEVDGKMLLGVVEEKDKEFLDTLGVKSTVHIRKIFTKFSDYCSTN